MVPDKSKTKTEEDGRKAYFFAGSFFKNFNAYKDLVRHFQCGEAKQPHWLSVSDALNNLKVVQLKSDGLATMSRALHAKRGRESEHGCRERFWQRIYET